jgi:hypothetical protein
LTIGCRKTTHIITDFELNQSLQPNPENTIKPNESQTMHQWWLSYLKDKDLQQHVVSDISTNLYETYSDWMNLVGVTN